MQKKTGAGLKIYSQLSIFSAYRCSALREGWNWAVLAHITTSGNLFCLFCMVHFQRKHIFICLICYCKGKKLPLRVSLKKAKWSQATWYTESVVPIPERSLKNIAKGELYKLYNISQSMSLWQLISSIQRIMKKYAGVRWSPPVGPYKKPLDPEKSSSCFQNKRLIHIMFGTFENYTSFCVNFMLYSWYDSSSWF